jgi:hypothetical protein
MQVVFCRRRFYKEAVQCCPRREDGCIELELEDVLQPHEVAAVAAVGPGGGPAFVLQVTPMAVSRLSCCCRRAVFDMSFFQHWSIRLCELVLPCAFRLLVRLIILIQT